MAFLYICDHILNEEEQLKIIDMKSYPLLQSQLGVFYDCLKYPQVMQYNIPCIVPLTDNIDIGRLKAAIQTIFAARKELRIRFFIDEKGEPR